MSEMQQAEQPQNAQVTGTAPVSEQAPSGEAVDHAERSPAQGLTETNPMEQAQAVQEAVPENYEPFKLGETYGDLKPEDAAEFVSAAKELGLSQEKAQKLAESAAPAMQKVLYNKLHTQIEGWMAASKADKEFGGERFNESMSIAKTAYEKFATPELKQAMNAAGLGCHPEFLRLFYRIGKTMQQDSGVRGSASNPEQSLAKRLFPNTPQMRDD